MKIKIVVILLVFIVLVAFSFVFVFKKDSPPQSEDYEVVSLLSLENRKVRVKIEFDGRTDRMIVELNQNERMCIQDARGLDTAAIILANKFIELPIVMRGGSGEAVRKCILICISKGKLYKSLDVISLIKNTITGISDIELNISGLIEKNNSFRLIIGETTIPFDIDNRIFFDGYYTLNGIYWVNSDKDYVKKQVTFQNEKYPSLFLQYIFIKNKWYSTGSNELMELTTNCD
jgi:hypothetical protein